MAGTRQPCADQIVAKPANEGERLLRIAACGREIGVVNVAVVGMEAGGVDAWQLAKSIQARPHAGPGAMPDRCIPMSRSRYRLHRHLRLDRGARDRPRIFLIVDQRREGGLGKRPHQLDEPRDVRPDRLIGEQHVRRAHGGHHFGLRDGGALEPGDPLRPGACGSTSGSLFVFMCGRSRSDAARHRDHAADVLFDAVGIDEQRRRGHLVDVLRWRTRCRHALASRAVRGLTSARRCASISTAIWPGSDPMPTALRAPMPRSRPNTSAKSSLQPLITLGWSGKSGVQLTMPSSLMTRVTRSRLPSSERSVARIARPTCRAAAARHRDPSSRRHARRSASPSVPHGPMAGHVRDIAKDDERLVDREQAWARAEAPRRSS